MSKQAAVGTLMVSLVLAIPGMIGAQESSPTPPKNLHLVGDHWTPWDPPEAGPDDYIIQRGDTLWDLAEKWLGDPFLWPQIWDENRYILDSHWIYPGDPLKVPGQPTVVPPQGIFPVEDDDGGEETAEDTGEGDDDSMRASDLLVVATPSDVYCSGYITPSYETTELQVAGREMERIAVAQGDVVYLNQGRNQGLSAGSTWTAVRAEETVLHPQTGRDLGTFVQRLAKLRVMVAQENTATAVIEESCDEIYVGEDLQAWQELPVPVLDEEPSFDRYDTEPTGGYQGYVVHFRDPITAAGAGHVFYADLGEGSDVAPGDLMNLFRDHGDLPRLMLGQGVVLSVESDTCMVMMTRAVREVEIGDRVEMVN